MHGSILDHGTFFAVDQPAKKSQGLLSSRYVICIIRMTSMDALSTHGVTGFFFLFVE
jgi:hypothetical protein